MPSEPVSPLEQCPYCDFAPPGDLSRKGGVLAVHLRWMHGEQPDVEDYMRIGLDQMHNEKSHAK